MASTFSRYFDVFTAKPGGKGADLHGRFEIPGEAVLELPEGRVRIYYDKAAGNPNEEGGFAPPGSLEIAITEAATGEEVEIRHKLASAVSSDERRSFGRCYVGRVEVPRAGSYKVKASVETDDPSPHLSLGK